MVNTFCDKLAEILYFGAVQIIEIRIFLTTVNIFSDKLAEIHHFEAVQIKEIQNNKVKISVG